MTSAAGDVLPALPPIRTTAPPPRAEDADARPSPAAASSSAGSPREREAEPTTPTSEESRIRPPTECPPAPRKPAWVAPPPGAKRRFPSPLTPPPRAFFPVARDLSAVFRALPPKKRIRAG